jgi:EF hand
MFPCRAQFAAVALSLLAGCLAPSEAVKVPRIEPDAIARRALEKFDKNKDGTLDDAELKATPGLRAAKAQFDADKNGKVSGEEITARFRRYVDANPGLVTIECRVTLDGQPLPEATVSLVPEPYMGDYPTATGSSDGWGSVSLRCENQPAHGVFCGLYRVEIKHEGGRALPARYNTQTELGCEVPPGSFSRGETKVTFALTSR